MDVVWVVAVGLAAGFVGGLLGVGGGILMVPAFLYLLHDRIPNINMAIGTSMALIVAIAISGTIGHARSGNVNWHVVAYVALFAVAGSLAGSWVSSFVPRHVLRRLFAVLLLAVAAKMFFSKPTGAEGASHTQSVPETPENPARGPDRILAGESPDSTGNHARQLGSRR